MFNDILIRINHANLNANLNVNFECSNLFLFYRVEGNWFESLVEN